MSFNQSKFQYYSAAAWHDATQVLGFSYVDDFLHPRFVEVTISDPENTLQSTYSTPWMFVRILERLTEGVLFFGRLTYCNPKYDESIGQVLVLGCKDLGVELEEAICTVDYTGDFVGACAPSAVISAIIDDYVYGGIGAGNIRATDISASTTNFVGAPTFESSKPTAWDAIINIAQRDKRTPAGTTYGWIFRVGNGVALSPVLAANGIYYYAGLNVGTRNDTEALDPVATTVPADGLTIAFRETSPSLVNGSGIATGSPITLLPGTNTITVTQLGTFDITMPAGDSGTATSGVACLVTGSPKALPAGATTTITTTSAIGTFTIDVTQQKLDMYGPYEFPAYSKEIITEVLVPYSDSGTGTYQIYTEQVPDGIGWLRDTLQIRRPKTIYYTGAQTAAEAQAVADAWISQYGQDVAPQKGKVQISQYPMYSKGGNTYFINAGHVVHIHHSLLAAVNNTNMLVTKVTYKEPECVAEIELLAVDAGWDNANYDMFKAMQTQKERTYGTSEMAPGSYYTGSVTPDVLVTATQPFGTNLVFTAPSQTQVTWATGAGNAHAITFQAGNVYHISATGSPHTITPGAVEYMYVTIGSLPSDSTVDMKFTGDFATAIDSGNALLAVCAEGPTASDKAYVWCSSGKAGLINTLLLTANCVQATQILAGSIQAAKLEADLVLSTQLIAGGIKGGGSSGVTMNSSGIEGYSAAGTTMFLLSNATGKATCGAGSVVLDSLGITLDSGYLRFVSGATYVGTMQTQAGSLDLIAAGSKNLTLYGDASASLTAHTGEAQINSTHANITLSAATYILISSTAGTYITLTANGSYPITFNASHLDADNTAFIDLPRQSGTPTGVVGRLFYDTADGLLKCYSDAGGAGWKTISWV